MADASTLWESLKMGDTWWVALVSFGLGAVGGLVHSVGDTEVAPVVPPVPGAPVVAPKKDKAKWLREMLVGAVAAVAILFIVRPADGVALVSSSLIAGYAGHAIMTALEDRAKALIAQQAAVVAQQQANTATQDVHRLIDAAEKVKPAAGGQVMGGGGAPAANTQQLDQVVADLKAKYQKTP